MFPWLRLLLVIAAFSCELRFAEGQSKVAQIEEVFQLTHMDQVQNAFIRQMAARNAPAVPTSTYSKEARAAADALSSQLTALYSKSMSWDRVKPEYVKAYDETFSEVDISAILAFYKSPSGQTMLQKTPLLIPTVQRRIAQQIAEDADVGREVKRLVNEAMEKSKSSPHN